LADVAGAEKELVAGHFGVCRGLAKSGDKELGPAMHRDECVLSRRYAGASQGRTTSILNVPGVEAVQMALEECLRRPVSGQCAGFSHAFCQPFLEFLRPILPGAPGLDFEIRENTFRSQRAFLIPNP
jgi:hypothetical protein